MPPVHVTSPSEWAQVCSQAFVPLGVRSAVPAFRATLVQRRLSDTVALTRVVSEQSEVIRDARTISVSPRENVLISLHRGGVGRVTQNGRSVDLAPGGATMYDTSKPYILEFPAKMSEIVLQLPRDAVAKAGNTFADLTAKSLPSGPGLTMLHALAAASSSCLESTNESELAALADALTGLAANIIGGLGADRLDGSFMTLSMRSYIGERFADAELTPELVAAAHHISLRYAQKLFARDGDSLAAYIRRARLDEAHRLLRMGARVGDAARRTGHYDLDSFTRAFKRQHGITPSSINVRRPADNSDDGGDRTASRP